MPYCPKCRAEYRDGFEKCADCGVDLVDELAPDAEETNDSLSARPEHRALESEVKLETFTNPIEFMYVAYLLDEMDIPYLVRKGKGDIMKDIYTMTLKFEKTIYVEEADYQKAEEVLESAEAYKLEEYDSEDYDDYDYDDDDYTDDDYDDEYEDDFEYDEYED